MRYWYCKDTSDGQTWLYMGTIRPVKDEWENSRDKSHIHY